MLSLIIVILLECCNGWEFQSYLLWDVQRIYLSTGYSSTPCGFVSNSSSSAVDQMRPSLPSNSLEYQPHLMSRPVGILAKPENNLEPDFWFCLDYCTHNGSLSQGQSWHWGRHSRGNVEKVIDGKDQRGAKAELLEDLDLVQVLDRDVENLSGF